MNTPLHNKTCVPCEGGVTPLVADTIQHLLEQVPDWVVRDISQNGNTIKTLQKRFQFANFRNAMAFLRQVEDIAESEGHHPDFCVHYNKVDFTIWTHAIGGLHENDFILAAKIDAIVSK
ncbi:MAG: 4a-hydroxytetrahydrobiopterin dehydratase [candidate division Zixibacteria bacterium]|nr:4a-hydroxytetrahydrobiopterin dehydratase [candidate division Zixibacteria bacterium]